MFYEYFDMQKFMVIGIVAFLIAAIAPNAIGAIGVAGCLLAMWILVLKAEKGCDQSN